MIRRFLGETAWVLAGQAATVAGTLVLVRVLTEYLSPASYGELALALTLVSFGQTVVYGGWTFTVTRFYAESQKSSDLHIYLNHCLRIVMRLSAIWCVVMAVLAAALALAEFDRAAAMVLLTLPFSVANGFVSTLNSIQNARRDRRNAALFQATEAWFRIGAVIAVVQLFGAEPAPVLMGYGGSSVVIAILIWRRLCRVKGVASHRGPGHADGGLAGRMRAYAWPFYIWGPFLWAQQSADRWALGAFTTTHEIGIYAAVMQLSFGPMRLLSSTFVRLAAPVLFGRVAKLEDAASRTAALRFVTKIAAVALGAAVLVFVIAFLLRDMIFAVLVGDAFADGAIYLPWMLLAAGLYATGQVLSLRLMGGDSTGHLILPNVVPAVIGVLLSVPGAWIGGVWGAVLSQLAFGLLQLIWLLAKAWRMDRGLNATKDKN